MSEDALASELCGTPKRLGSSSRELLERQLVGSKLLLLDVDDTIVDTRGAMVLAGTAAAAALWPGRADVHTDWARHYYDDPAQWFRRYASGEVAFETMRACRLEEASTALDLAMPADAHGAFEDAYAPAFRAAQRLFPDVLPLLEAAEAAQLPVALLTNSSHAATVMKLDALSITDRFVAVVTTDTIGVGKPDPRVYAEACRLAGVAAGDSVCIGDSLEWDVLGAAAAGLRAIWLDRAGEGSGPEVPRVRDLHEVRLALPTGASRAADLGD